MAENVNTGLAEALSEGTRLSGEFGNPISKGLQLGMQNDFARLQKEQERQAKLAKVEEDIAKFSSIDTGTWYSQERGRKVKKLIDEGMAKAIDAKRSGNAVEAERIKQQLKNEIAVQKGVDTDHKALMTASDKSVTKPRALKLYNTGGVGALDAENRKHFFAPVAQIDMESGSFKINNVNNPNIDNILRTRIATLVKDLPKTKLVKGVNGEVITEIDPNSLEYKAAKQNAIDGIVENDDLVNQIVYTQDFIDYYDKYLEKNNLGEVYEEDEDAPKIVEDALRGFVEEKYKLNEGKKVRYKSIPSGGKTSDNAAYYSSGKNSGRWNFTPIDNGSIEIEVEGNPSATPVFSGEIDGKKTSLKLIKPNVKYIGNDVFEVSGLMDLGGGVLTPTKKPLKVSKSSITSIFGLTEQGLKAKLGYKSQGGQAAPKKKRVYVGLDANGNPQYKEQ